MTDFHGFAAELAAHTAKVETTLSQVVRKSAADVERDAKAAAPVDTGNLRGSIGTTMAGPLMAQIAPTASYGVYLEMGTSRMGPQPYLFPSLDRHTEPFINAVGKVADL